jgi:C1A family cysteine protease
MNCGSCWAFSAAAFLEDRFCIASNKAINIRLSPQDMVNCDYNNFACNGGYLTPSLTYLVSEGLVSENCLPYQNKGSLCAYKCDSSSEQYKKYACKAGSMTILTGTEQIQQEIMTNGPMMVGFTVYRDFMYYSNGVYEPTV